MLQAEKTMERLLQKAGVTLNGENPWDVQVHDRAVYNRILTSGRLAIGESFMDEQWDCDDLQMFFEKMLSSGADEDLKSLSTLLLIIKAKLINLQSKQRSFEVGEEHYDIGNEFYELMLTGHMQYTCDLWRDGAENLMQAQEAKLDLICKKLKLEPGKRLLDVGCGWGGLMRFASENYGVECVGISVSKEQTQWATDSFGSLPCSIEVTDYRDFQPKDTFDYVTSIEMIEHVGPRNYKNFFSLIHSWLKPEGKFLLQAIGAPEKVPSAEPWINKYIFPNGILPSLYQIEDATRYFYHWEHFENIGVDYEKTLQAWWNNLHEGYDSLRKIDPEKYDERFLRTFKYYLLSSAAMAKLRKIHDWQILFTKK